MDDDFNVPAALDHLDEVAKRVLAGAALEGEQLALSGALATLGFRFAGAEGPAA